MPIFGKVRGSTGPIAFCKMLLTNGGSDAFANCRCINGLQPPTCTAPEEKTIATFGVFYIVSVTFLLLCFFVFCMKDRIAGAWRKRKNRFSSQYDSQFYTHVPYTV